MVGAETLAVEVNFLSLKHPEQIWDQSNLLYNGSGILPQGVKWLVYEGDHSPPPTAMVKNE